ncbi:unnamed protein product [Calypogeia fissa]
MEEEKIRLFVGGLPSEVGAGDLQERFAPLGNVKSITLPSATTGPGHRGFAYVDFVPASDAALRKLFSAYNGCKWRGGLLRVEKAKEHFSDRLQREWAAEAASLTVGPPFNEEVVPQSALISSRQKQAKGGNTDMEADGLKIFFPKLKKLKSVPSTGLGKHKRSFQRVESSPLQILLAGTCEESLRPGSLHGSNIIDGISSLKEGTCHENDDIAQAIKIERQRQLQLLHRLFPVDSTSIRLENQQVLEVDISEEKGEGAVDSVEKSSSGQTLLPMVTERVKQDIIEKGHSSPLDSKLDPDNGETIFEEDSTSTAVAMERAKQLELMHRLFPADAPSTREPETALQPEVSTAKKKRKLDTSKHGGDLEEPVMDGPRGAISDHSVRWQHNLAEINCEHQSSEPQNLLKQHEQELKMSKTILASKSDDSLEGPSMMNLNSGDDVVPDAIAEDQEMLSLQSIEKVTPETLSEDDSEMVLNVGDDSLSLATAEEQEKHELKSLSVRANELLVKVSDMTRHLNANSLSLTNAEERGRQMSKSSQDGILEKGMEDSEMTLNLGNGYVPLSKAEEQERALVRSFSTAKHYNWTRTQGSSDSEDSEEEDSSEEQANSNDYANDVEQGDEADSEKEECFSSLQGDSNSSSDAEEGDEVEDSETDEHFSEEQDDSLHSSHHLELLPTVRKTTSKLPEASLQRRVGESSVGRQLDESSKWDALADMCQFRPASTMQSEEGSKPERNSVPVANSDIGESMPSELVTDFQVDERKSPLQQPTDADNNGGKPDSSGQKLTRAAWKSLVGETGRVVFSLRQVTGKTPLSTHEAQIIGGPHTQVEPAMRSSISNTNEGKSKLSNGAAEKKQLGVSFSVEPKMKAAERTNTLVNLLVSSSDVCPFMKSENAEKEWLATKSELRSDYRAKQKHAARNVKKLWVKR